MLVKVFNGGQLREINEFLKGKFEDLDVELTAQSNSANKWVQVSVSGEDEAVVTNFIRKEIGICPSSLDEVEAGDVIKGFVSRIEENKIAVDIGVLKPKNIQATISAKVLQEQLVSGKNVAFPKVVEGFGICEGVPISVKLISKTESEVLQCELSPDQVEKFSSWRLSLLDRLIVLRASKDLVSSVLDRTKLYRDIIDVETLGMFEYALTCKLGTDARGVIPRVGRYMRNVVFVVFDAKRAFSLF